MKDATDAHLGRVALLCHVEAVSRHGAGNAISLAREAQPIRSVKVNLRSIGGQRVPGDGRAQRRQLAVLKPGVGAGDGVGFRQEVGLCLRRDPGEALQGDRGHWSESLE